MTAALQHDMQQQAEAIAKLEVLAQRAVNAGMEDSNDREIELLQTALGHALAIVGLDMPEPQVRWRVQRSFLERRIDTYEVWLPADFDPDDYDFGDVDDQICNGTHRTPSTYDLVDGDRDQLSHDDWEQVSL